MKCEFIHQGQERYIMNIDSGEYFRHKGFIYLRLHRPDADLHYYGFDLLNQKWVQFDKDETVALMVVRMI